MLRRPIGLTWRAWANQVYDYLDGLSGGVSDGDKGDVTVSGSGATWTIDAGVVTAAKFQDIATARIVGRVTVGAGSVESLTGTQATTLIDEATVGLKGAMSAADKAKLNGISAGATVTLNGTATLTIPANALEDTETVAATGVTALSKVNVWLAPHDDSDENSPEMLDIAAMQATPGAGTITVSMAFLTPTSGPIKLQWSAF